MTPSLLAVAVDTDGTGRAPVVVAPPDCFSLQAVRHANVPPQPPVRDAPPTEPCGAVWITASDRPWARQRSATGRRQPIHPRLVGGRIGCSGDGYDRCAGR